MTKERIYYLDYVKGFAILLIVCAHCIQFFPAMKELSRFVCSIHVPIFFIVSGMIHRYFDNKNQLFADVLRKRFRSLIIPYIFFSLFNSILKLGVLFVTHKLSNEIISAELIALFIKGNGTVWFLMTLFLAELLFYWGVRLNQYLFALTLIVANFLPFILNVENNPFFLVVNRVILAYSFLGIGFYLCGFIKHLQWQARAFWGCISLLAWLLLNIFLGYSYGMFKGYYAQYFNTMLIILFGSIGFILLFSIIVRKINILVYIGQNSLIIMLVHPIILLFYIYFLAGIGKNLNSIEQVLLSTSLFVTIVLLCFPFIQLINTKIPFVIGKRKL